MAWEQRGGRRIYYRSERSGGRVRRVYVGSGPVAELAAGLDGLGRLDRRDRAGAWRDELARHDSADALLAGMGRLVAMVTAAAMEASGFHRVDRGKWRRRMNPGELETIAEPLTPEDAREVLEAARRGDRSVLPALRGLLDAHPEVWSRLGDLAAHVERAWVDLAAGPDLALGESIARKLAGLKAELAGPAPSPLERLLVDRVAATWAQAAHADAVAAQARGRDLSPAQLDLLARRQARAGRGHTEAIKALAAVHRLLRVAPRPAAADRECVAEAMRREAREARPGKSERPIEKSAKRKQERSREETEVVSLEGSRESAMPEPRMDRRRTLVKSQT